MNKIKPSILPGFFISVYVLSFSYRLSGISHTHPFWIDEFSSATQALKYMHYGLNTLLNFPAYKLEFQNISTHILIAASMKLFGISTFAARLPIVIIGSLVPLCVYLFTCQISSRKVAVGAALLTTFSNILIMWSTQARSYSILQVLVLIALYLYLKSITYKSKKWLILLTITSLLGLLTHLTYFLLIISFFISFLIFDINKTRLLIKSKFFWITILSIFILAFYFGGIYGGLNYINNKMIGANNMWYYHSFLWREYNSLTLFGILGLLIPIFLNFRRNSIVLIYLIVHLFFVSYIFSHHMTKYVLVLFPLLYIGFANSLYIIVSKIKLIKMDSQMIYYLLICMIILNGHKYTQLPKQYYSINKDFREISNIDYDKIYAIPLTKKYNLNDKIAFIDTWIDRTNWYFPTDNYSKFLFSWENETSFSNGHLKKTPFFKDANGYKRISDNIGFISNTHDLSLVMQKYRYGFLFIDDDTLPQDVIEYAKKNLKKELYLDHYPLDDNPYSIWPATLYSWGF